MNRGGNGGGPDCLLHPDELRALQRLRLQRAKLAIRIGWILLACFVVLAGVSGAFGYYWSVVWTVFCSAIVGWHLRINYRTRRSLQ